MSKHVNGKTIKNVAERMDVRLKLLPPSKTPEGRAAAYKKWREQNPEQAKEISRKRAAKRKANNPGKVAEESHKASAKWRANNSEHCTAYNAAYYQANKEQCDARHAADLKANPEKHSIRNRKHWAANRDKLNQRRRQCDLANLERRILRNAKVRAQQQGLEFDLELSDIIIPAVCPVLGIPIKRDNTRLDKNAAPSLDRIDNAKGYVKGNVWIISFRANAIKRDATLDELRLLVAALERQQISA